ncbi:MAG TPA: hypothetical protein VF491_16935 [Vicinamibacterales bacterium]
MKTIIKIVVAIAILSAAFNASRAALFSYQFQDAVHDMLVFNPRATDPEIVSGVMKLANEMGVPIQEENIAIRAIGLDLYVDMTYTTNVVLVPGVYNRDWTFTPSTSTRMLAVRPR